MVWFFVACGLTCMKTEGTDCHSITSLRKRRLQKGDRQRAWEEVAGRAPSACCSVSPDHRGTRFTKRSERKEQRRLSANCPDSLMNDVTTPSALHGIHSAGSGPRAQWAPLRRDSASEPCQNARLCPGEPLLAPRRSCWCALSTEATADVLRGKRKMQARHRV